MAKQPLTKDLQFEKKNQNMVKLPGCQSSPPPLFFFLKQQRKETNYLNQMPASKNVPSPIPPSHPPTPAPPSPKPSTSPLTPPS